GGEVRGGRIRLGGAPAAAAGSPCARTAATTPSRRAHPRAGPRPSAAALRSRRLLLSQSCCSPVCIPRVARCSLALMLRSRFAWPKLVTSHHTASFVPAARFAPGFCLSLFHPPPRGASGAPKGASLLLSRS